MATRNTGGFEETLLSLTRFCKREGQGELASFHRSTVPVDVTRGMTMPSRSHSVESKALSLPLQQRAQLVVRLLDSIEQRSSANPGQVQRAWLEEANRRYEAYLRGDEQTLSAKQAFAELHAEDR